MAVRINQSVVEAVTLQTPNVLINQSCVEFVTLPLPPVISCGNPPGGQVGAPYSHTFPVLDGAPPFTFSIIAGTLPPGISLDSSTGVASGVPTLAGTFEFTIQVTDVSFQTSSVACSIVIGAPLPGPTGGPPELMCNRVPNGYDWCLANEIWRTKRIHFPPRCPIPKEFMNLLPWDDTFGAIPYQAVPFNIPGTIVTPGPADGDVLVCQGRVPLGYDGILTGIYQVYQGSGMQQGNGDIVWRIRRNQVWVPGLSSQPYALGNPRNPVPLTEGQILFSGTLFGYYVNVPNTQGTIQVGSSLVTCGLLGFYWPR